MVMFMVITVMIAITIAITRTTIYCVANTCRARAKRFPRVILLHLSANLWRRLCYCYRFRGVRTEEPGPKSADRPESSTWLCLTPNQSVLNTANGYVPSKRSAENE